MDRTVGDLIKAPNGLVRKQALMYVKYNCIKHKSYCEHYLANSHIMDAMKAFCTPSNVGNDWFMQGSVESKISIQIICVMSNYGKQMHIVDWIIGNFFFFQTNSRKLENATSQPAHKIGGLGSDPQHNHQSTDHRHNFSIRQLWASGIDRGRAIEFRPGRQPVAPVVSIQQTLLQFPSDEYLPINAQPDSMPRSGEPNQR